jgi:acyl-CoA thioesterase-2
MSKVLDDVVTLLALERIEENLFRGQSQDIGWRMVFGGQVLGQALSAAVQTVPPERQVHSLHAYFLRPGDVARPILYAVERLRDGASFTTRGITAVQGGRPIFTMSASFQAEQDGFDHQDAMPSVPEPEALQPDRERLTALAEHIPAGVRHFALAERPFEFRTVEGHAEAAKPTPRPPHRAIWLRSAGLLPDAPALHRYLLAYVSDFGFLSTSLLPHGVSWRSPTLRIASLDHAMWFRGPLRVDGWLLYVMDSPAAHGGRGLVRGRIFSRDGRLVASVAQEGMIRQQAE